MPTEGLKAAVAGHQAADAGPSLGGQPEAFGRTLAKPSNIAIDARAKCMCDGRGILSREIGRRRRRRRTRCAGLGI
jgi:hypothetical protein